MHGSNIWWCMSGVSCRRRSRTTRRTSSSCWLCFMSYGHGTSFCWSDVDLRTDNQVITSPKTNRHLRGNKM